MTDWMMTRGQDKRDQKEALGGTEGVPTEKMLPPTGRGTETQIKRRIVGWRGGKIEKVREEEMKGRKGGGGRGAPLLRMRSRIILHDPDTETGRETPQAVEPGTTDKGLQKTLKRGVETRNKKAGEKRAEKRSNIVVLKEQSLCVIDEGDQGLKILIGGQGHKRGHVEGQSPSLEIGLGARDSTAPAEVSHPSQGQGHGVPSGEHSQQGL